jgi:hypothetical protein
MTFYGLNRAKTHDDYLKALNYYYCPGQNFVFASHAGDIAIRQQGHFPKKLAVPAALMLQASINSAAFALTDGKLGITREEYLDTFERLLRGLR